jgi:hypothetical protein
MICARLSCVGCDAVGAATTRAVDDNSEAPMGSDVLGVSLFVCRADASCEAVGAFEGKLPVATGVFCCSMPIIIHLLVKMVDSVRLERARVNRAVIEALW